ncbi:dihydrofolate reductase [Blastomonas marina]|uniref:Dihydrofolate reductase n=1 Tax=Blastomonas marina TaxID=1867408 RepID=A0ABQ1F6R4_9SPHN|nr:dihydrofolate reductase family protein [Blastomonas marina]GGA00952.1 dihydrofolate reductase [Blastomonas marina]
MPRKITGAAFISLDGIVQSPGGPDEDPTGGFDEGGWVFKLWDEGLEPTLGALFSGEYDLLLGRRTYDIFAAYWPYVEGENKPMGEAFDRANKYVLTRDKTELEWQNSHRLAGVDNVAQLKAGDGPRLVIQGSSTIYPDLLAAGLIDELILMIFPLTLGQGKRLFGTGTPVDRLEMTAHTVTPRGTTIATYRPGGELPPYPDTAPDPIESEAEAVRQQRMKEGRW